MRLKKVMEDRPDLIASELSGLAFDSLQQCFRLYFDVDFIGVLSILNSKNQHINNRKSDVERMIYDLRAPTPIIYEDVFIFVDPAAGGPSSDYGILSVVRNRGILVVSFVFLPIPDDDFDCHSRHQELVLDHVQC